MNNQQVLSRNPGTRASTAWFLVLVATACSGGGSLGEYTGNAGSPSTDTGGTAVGGPSSGGNSPNGTGGTATGGGGGTGAAGLGGTGGVGGAASRSCVEIEDAYGAAFDQAQSCTSSLNSLQCQLVVSVGLLCGCGAVVNERNTEALAALEALRLEYSRAGCVHSVNCGACPNVQPTTESGGCATLGGVCLSVMST